MRSWLHCQEQGENPRYGHALVKLIGCPTDEAVGGWGKPKKATSSLSRAATRINPQFSARIATRWPIFVRRLAALSRFAPKQTCGAIWTTLASTLRTAIESKADAIEVSLASEILGFPTETLGPMYWADAYTRHFLMSQRRDVDDFVLPLPGSRVRRAAGLQLNGTRMTSYG